MDAGLNEEAKTTSATEDSVNLIQFAEDEVVQEEELKKEEGKKSVTIGLEQVIKFLGGFIGNIAFEKSEAKAEFKQVFIDNTKPWLELFGLDEIFSIIVIEFDIKEVKVKCPWYIGVAVVIGIIVTSAVIIIPQIKKKYGELPEKGKEVERESGKESEKGTK